MSQDREARRARALVREATWTRAEMPGRLLRGSR